MTYQVLARKWRPQTFTDMVGQDHISSTLCNAIKNERIGHAYLFVGTRGTGKTTTARIFAKAINCENPLPDANPCDKCNNCVEITKGSSMDVLEIDGASNNGVDDIRRLRDNVQYTPARCKYKVYIIDEVHMLTTAAWNALLKTLEEPPEHVKFLFATTEAHKVLPTILSRCQRFDLKRISQGTIARRLKYIATEEKALFDESALNSIARAANGGMRDALSIMDQMIAFCNNQKNITEHDVSDVFGLTSSFDLAKIVSAILSDNAISLIGEINRLADLGRNLEQLYSDLLYFSRNLMIASISAEQATEILDLDEHELSTIFSIASQTTPDIVQKLVDGFLTNDGKLRGTLNKRVFIEMTLLRIMKDAHAVSLNEILKRINIMRQGGALEELTQQAPTQISVSEDPEKKKIEVDIPAPVEVDIPAPIEIKPSENEVSTADPLTKPEAEYPSLVQANSIEEEIHEASQAHSDIQLVEVDGVSIENHISSELEKLETVSDHPVLNQQENEAKSFEKNDVKSDIQLMEVDGVSIESHLSSELEKLGTTSDQPVLNQEVIESTLSHNTSETDNTSKEEIDDSYTTPFSTLLNKEYPKQVKKSDPLKIGLKKFHGSFDTENETSSSSFGIYSPSAVNTVHEGETIYQAPQPEQLTTENTVHEEETIYQAPQPEQLTTENTVHEEETIYQAPQPEQLTTENTIHEEETIYQAPQPEQLTTENTIHEEASPKAAQPTEATPEVAAQKLWLLIEQKLSPLLQSSIEKIIPLSYQDNTFFVAIESHTDELLEAIAQLESILREVSGTDALEVKTVAAQKDKEVKAPELSSSEDVWERAKSDQFISGVCDTFDGKIIDVRG